MLKNFWYAVELTAKVAKQPVLLKVLGQDIVLYRGADGAVNALSNLCIHRGGSLAGGWVDGNCIRCPYHGWKFDGEGTCVEIPANRTPVVPKRAAVDSYPTEERYGFVWVFLGDLPESERPPIPHIPEAEDDGWTCVSGDFTWNAHYARVTENGIDIAHTPFVHRNSFGNIAEPQIEDYAVDLRDYGASATATLMPPLPRGLWKLLRRKRTPVKATVGFEMPNITRLELDLGKWKTVVVDSNIPVDENTTRTIFLSFRNFFRGRWANRDAKRRMMKIFLEDQATVESQKPELLPYDLAAELHVKSDVLGVTYRKMRNRYLDRGWGIDSEKLRREFDGRKAAVIPCPRRRRANGEGNGKGRWVIPEVPTADHNLPRS
jgi:phenylpropionate dioxygenase-like ring-hydroxylating dioxygenase large terminal subunit